MTKILAIGMIMLVLSFPWTMALMISDIGHSEITAKSAKITWKTDENSSTLVKYGVVQLNQTQSGPGGTTLHEVTLSGLDAGREYKYQVHSDDERSIIYHFTTVDTRTNFLQVDELPEAMNNRTLNVSGKTRADSRFFIFLNNKENAQVREYGVGPDFNFQLVLDPGAYNNETMGLNKIEIKAWDLGGNKDAETFYVLLDETPPSLSVTGIPTLTNRDSVNVSGRTDPGTTIEIYVKGSKKEDLIAENGTFLTEVDLGRDGEFNVTVIARDNVGNEAKYEKLVTIDRKAPTIEWITNFQGTTHFKLYKIEGKTEPDSKVVVLNFGKYSGCDDIGLKDDYGSCKTFIKDTVKYDEFIGVIDPVTWGVGTQIKTEADSHGKFSVTVPLLPSEDKKVSVNNLLFTVTDPAGNTNEQKRQVKYEPGCNNWHVGIMESYPYNIYTRELSEGNIEASTFFPVQYLGGGTVIKVTNVEIGKDRYNVKYLEHDQQRMDQLFDMGNGARVSMYDTERNQIYVYAPIKIKQYRGSLNDLPDNLQAYMYVRITYSVDGNSATCDVFTTAVFDIHKPVLISKWLSPTMINNTIQALDNMIRVTKAAVKNLRTASILGLVACGAMIAYNYISGFFASEETVEEGQCTEAENNMEMTYWVCDRILCPNVPPKCDDFNPLAGDEYMIGDKTVTREKYNEKVGEWEKAWNEQDQAVHDKMSKEEWYRQAKAEDYELTPWDQMQIPSIYTTNKKVMTPTGEDREEITIRYYEVKNRRIVDKDAVNVDFERYQISVNVHSTMDTQASQLGDGTLMVIYKTTEKWKASIYGYGDKVGEVAEIRQVRGQSPSQIGPPDASRLVGCYNAGCPEFDKTKCLLGEDDINPASDIWSSAKCVCLPGLLEHLRNYLQIMEGAKKCLQQALIGEVRGGFCERLLAQFVCDLLIQAFKAAMDIMEDPNQFGLGDDFGPRDNVKNYKKNSNMVTDQLSGRYSDIVKNKFGLTSDRIVNRACVVAFTGDWSLLESVFDDFVEAIEVEPVAYINAESRPYGHDPFSGRMNIGYNVYVGVVPGGETKIKVWLECNRNAPNGKYCGQDVNNLEVRGFRNHLSKDDAPLNENIVFTDKGSRYWYNQVVMQLEYRIGGEWQKDVMTANIWQKGDLSSSCHIDAGTGEIMCDILEELMPSGIVELLSASQTTHLSPAVSRYRDGDPVNALVKIRNSFADPFWLIVQYPSSNKKIMYKIEPSPGGYQRLEHYNIWLDTVSTTSSGGAGTTDQTWILHIGQELKDRFFGIHIEENYLESMDATILYKLENGAKSHKCRVYTEAQRSEKRYMAYVNGNPMTGKVNVLLKQETICKSAPDPSVCELLPEDKFLAKLDRFHQGFYKCMTDYDDFGDFKGKDVVGVSTVTYTNPSWKTYKYEQFVKAGRMGVSYIGVTGVGEQELKAKGSTSQSRKTVSINVFQDTTDDGVPDTPIVFTGGGGDQEVQFKYDTGTSTDPKPRVDFVEPIGNYFNGVGEAIPLGFNIWNADSLTIEISERSGKFSCKAEFTHLGISVSDIHNSCGRWMNGRSTINDATAPPFVEILLTPLIDMPKESTDIYTVTVSSGEIKVDRKFAFEKNLTKDDVIVCLGGSFCSGNWQPGVGGPSVDLGAFNASAMPGVRVR